MRVDYRKMKKLSHRCRYPQPAADFYKSYATRVTAVTPPLAPLPRERTSLDLCRLGRPIDDEPGQIEYRSLTNLSMRLWLRRSTVYIRVLTHGFTTVAHTTHRVCPHNEQK